jgi:hypothetical protein
VTFEDELTQAISAPCLTRRERRVEREQARPARGVAGWVVYAVAVAVVIVGAAWMASATEASGHRVHTAHQPTAAAVSTR